MGNAVVAIETVEIASEEKIPSPLRAIRQYCVHDCCCGQANEVRLCSAVDCPLYAWRFGRKPEKGLSTLKAIRARCIDCSARNLKDVRVCHNQTCVLYPCRMGHNPNLKGKRRGNAEALRQWREAQMAGANSE